MHSVDASNDSPTTTLELAPPTSPAEADRSSVPGAATAGDEARRNRVPPWVFAAAAVIVVLVAVVWAVRSSDAASLGHQPATSAPDLPAAAAAALGRDADQGPATTLETESDGPVESFRPEPEGGAATSVVDLDGDGDGALDVDDNCPAVANPAQADLDQDAIGDECDTDDDGDGVADDSDNCPVDVNGGQEDIDTDGLGDACDAFPDQDGDGIIDTDDPCIELPGDPDGDSDGIPDKCDASPRGMIAVAASARIERVSVLNDAYDGEPDLFGDLTVAGTKFGLREIANQREIRPDDWVSGPVTLDEDETLVRVRIWIRDEAGFCLFCHDGLVDVTPEPAMNALHLLIDTSTGAVHRADDDWNQLGVIGTLTGSSDGDLTGTITQQGDDDAVHVASMDVSLTLVREPAP